MSVTLGWKRKDPSDERPFAVDWSDELGTADTITGLPVFAISPSGSLTQADVSATDTRAQVWLSGGTTGVDYEVTCTIQTTGGRTLERTFGIQVREL